MKTTPSTDALIEGLQSFAQTVDGVPTIREMRIDGPYSPYYYKDEFGSWHQALRRAGIQPTHGFPRDVSRPALIEELQNVAEQADRPPRRRDVDEYGEYDYTLYDEEFSSFIHALKEADIEPDEKQYRFSSVETPDHKQGSANIEKLRQDGPTPGTDLSNGVSAKDRELGIWKFGITSGTTTPADPIYYLNNDHAPELVLRRFFQHNPDVLEYRSPHGIKMEIADHKPSWKDIGQDIVDELVESGLFPDDEFEHLVIIHCAGNQTFQTCAHQSITSPVDTHQLPIENVDVEGARPLWGFPREHKAIWEALSTADGLLFSTRDGVYTHYVPVGTTIENQDVMTELWVKYEDGIRSGGIDKPWPYLVVGETVHEFNLPAEELSEVLDDPVPNAGVKLFDETATTSLQNRHGGFEPFLRNRDSATDQSASIDLPDDATPNDVVTFLLEIPLADYPFETAQSQLETVDKDVRTEGFREGIYEIYSGCAVCGRLLEAPDGDFDLHATHILPASANGPDVLQNGLGLCSRHRWAFEHDWFEITTEYEIQVHEHTELEGYDEMRQHQGQRLYLPNDESHQPHPHYFTKRYQ